MKRRVREGDFVHVSLVARGENTCRAAFVTKVSESGDCISVTLFLYRAEEYHDDLEYSDETPPRRFSWHWPEK